MRVVGMSVLASVMTVSILVVCTIECESESGCMSVSESESE